MICNGSAISRTTYSALFEAIGTTWGTGDGSTTFALPNLINRVMWGGTTSGTYKEAGLPNITGSFPLENGGSSDNITGAFYHNGNVDGVQGVAGSKDVNVAFSATRSSSIYGKSSTVQPPAATLLPIIKY